MFGSFSRGAGDALVAGRVRRLGGGDVKRGAVSLPSGRIGCRWFGIHQDLGALGDEQGDETQVYRIVRERHAQVWEHAVGEIEMRIWMVGLDAVGDTAVSWELKQDEAAIAIPTIGSNLESSCSWTCAIRDIGSDLSNSRVPPSAADSVRVQMRSLAHSRRRDETVARECVSTCIICAESMVGVRVEV